MVVTKDVQPVELYHPWTSLEVSLERGYHMLTRVTADTLNGDRGVRCSLVFVCPWPLDFDGHLRLMPLNHAADEVGE